MEEFPRIKRLPPYVFNVTGELKLAARRRGEDVVDFSMGNPDQPTPRHIVEKLIETVQRLDTHRYSVSKGIPRLRRAICNWYQSRYGVELDPDSEAIVTIGSKEGIALLDEAGFVRAWNPVLQKLSGYPEDEVLGLGIPRDRLARIANAVLVEEFQRDVVRLRQLASRRRLAIGLRRPTSGSIRVLGTVPTQDPAWLARVGFVAQDRPLYAD